MPATGTPVVAAAAAGATPEIDTPDEVTAALSRLADLRDRGAISPEDYEAEEGRAAGSPVIRCR